MSVYIVKFVVPIAIPARKPYWGNPSRILSDDHILIPDERVNLIDRDYIVEAKNFKNAVEVFFASPPTEQPLIHEVEAQNGAGFQLPLAIHKWYIIRVVSSIGRKHDYCLFTSVMGRSDMIKLNWLHDDVRRLIGETYPDIPGPYDMLVKGKNVEDVRPVIDELRDADINHESPIAHAIKAVRGEWRFVAN